MSTVAEIKNAIENLSPTDRAELESLLWPDWDRAEGDNPPSARDKLAEAARGHFQAGERLNLKKILSRLDSVRPDPCLRSWIRIN
jgi:hypothetical protein